MTIDGGLSRMFRNHLPDFDWLRVETGSTSQGVPDSNYCCGGIEGWIEFKSTSRWAVQFRPHQVAWIERRTRAGGRIWIAVRRKADAGPKRGRAVDELWLFPGQVVRRLDEYGLRAPSFLFTDQWDWKMIRAALLSP